VAEVEGMAGLRDALNELKFRAAKNAITLASRHAAKIIQAEAQAAAPVGDVAHKTYKGRLVAPGFLKRGINVAVRYLSRKGAVLAKIGPRREAFYGTQFLEIGTSKMPKQPWLVPAYEAKKDEAVQVFVTTLRAAIARAKARGMKR
jgi:HK97 gp10 family phage protein